jgi:hypothetical protein
MLYDADGWLVNLLAAMISLRVFTFRYPPALPWAHLLSSEEVHLLFVRTVTNRVPHLEYFAAGCVYHWKRVHGEWVPCNKVEFPLHRQLRKSLH